MKKSIALVLAAVLLIVATVGGTLAWLTAKTDTVTNTFTTSDITVTLEETTGTSYKMVPGYTLTKDPKATVKAGSEDCYLFVKLEKSSNFDTYMTYTMADGWTALTGVDGVYYRTVNASTADQDFAVLKDNAVKVKDDVTKAQMNALTASDYPTLKVTAYACQLNSSATTTFTPADAWAKIS